ncbi:putative inositol transporter 2 isoform X1 [Cucumis melo var. makuwa]|uniref:Inositol transporter 2 isoform X1 n=1 Tax=Cucumis melo var. makuwa TaxID=1194695 RepID=A0A5A7UFN0_CUCMM|nr:putative inositol transporter 2 isoform X1 [Cucumis melo var. makuwa]
MEGGTHGSSSDGSSGFRESFSLPWKNPFVLRLALSAGIGGFLFGYDIGVISGALLYIRDDFKSVDKSTVLQETIVSMAIAGAVIGAAIGGWMNDRYGRRTVILMTDVLFFIGAVFMATSPAPSLLIVGRVFVGLGIGMVSMTSPLYISEASSPSNRGALVNTIAFLIPSGQLLSYLITLAFAKAPGTWRWMLGVTGILALLQCILMFFLPESPRWLYRKGRIEEAERILRKIYSENEVEGEIKELKESVEAEIKEKEGFEKISLIMKLKTKTVRRGLYAGVGLQIFQQLVGINTVMYYRASIIQLAGFASNETAILLSLVTVVLNALSSIVSIYCIDKTGRKRLLIISLLGVIISLGILSVVFHETTSHPPLVSITNTPFKAYTCPDYSFVSNSASWDCMKCLKSSSPNCGFCALGANKFFSGECLVANDTVKHLCHNYNRLWYTRGCPSRFGWLALLGLALYIVFFSLGVGPVPWLVNAEIYPLRYRGVCGGIAATANWISNLVVAQSFLSLTQSIGPSWTFLIFGLISVVTILFVLTCVPETKGVPIEEIEQMLEKRALHFKFWEKRADL